MNSFLVLGVFSGDSLGFPTWAIISSALSLVFSSLISMCLECISLGVLLGASVRHSGGPWQRSWGRRLDICKGGIEPQESPWKSSSIYPHNQSLPTLLLCAHLHLWLYGGLSPTTSFREGVNLELQFIIIPGRDKSVLTYKLLWRFSGLPDRLVRPHVIAHSLPTVRGTRCFKPSKNRFLRKVRKL